MTSKQNKARQRRIEWQLRAKSLFITLVALFFVFQGYVEVISDRTDYAGEDPYDHYHND
jgi:Tfp pilus assembly protein PilO